MEKVRQKVRENIRVLSLVILCLIGHFNSLSLFGFNVTRGCPAVIWYMPWKHNSPKGRRVWQERRQTGNPE